MSQKIKMVRGRTEAFEVPVTDAEGVPYELADGESVIFGIKKNAKDNAAIFTKLATHEGSGVYRISLIPEDTESIDPGDYVYDVGLRSGTDFFTIIEISPFTLLPNVTKRSDAT